MTANMLFRQYFPALLQSPINCGAFAMIAGMVIVPMVSLFTKKPEKSTVDGMFACYDKKVEVPQKLSLPK